VIESASLVDFSSAEAVASAEPDARAAPFTTKLAPGNVSPAFSAATAQPGCRAPTPANHRVPDLPAPPERFRINI
jgi:hypothetical protein